MFPILFYCDYQILGLISYVIIYCNVLAIFMYNGKNWDGIFFEENASSITLYLQEYHIKALHQEAKELQRKRRINMPSLALISTKSTSFLKIPSLVMLWAANSTLKGKISLGASEFYVQCSPSFPYPQIQEMYKFTNQMVPQSSLPCYLIIKMSPKTALFHWNGPTKCITKLC